MGSMSRAKGNRAEVDVVNWLRLHGYPDARRYLAGDGRQPGDIDGVPGLAIEVKNCARWELSAWMHQVEAEARRNLPVVLIKPRGVVTPGQWYAVMRFEQLMDLVRPRT